MFNVRSNLAIVVTRAVSAHTKRDRLQLDLYWEKTHPWYQLFPVGNRLEYIRLEHLVAPVAVLFSHRELWVWVIGIVTEKNNQTIATLPDDQPMKTRVYPR
jgi:hypothetical protein